MQAKLATTLDQLADSLIPGSSTVTVIEPSTKTSIEKSTESTKSTKESTSTQLSAPIYTIQLEDSATALITEQNSEPVTYPPKTIKEPISKKLPLIDSIFKFGTFKGRPLEWIVLDTQGSEITLLSKYGLVCRSYNDSEQGHTEPIATTWDKSSLRAWLNKVFYNKTFNNKEKQQIITQEVIAETIENHELYPGENTFDPVSILSINEYKHYFGEQDRHWRCFLFDKRNVKRQCWLRNYGKDKFHGCFIGRSGSIHEGGSLVNSSRNTVRPVIKIKFE